MDKKMTDSVFLVYHGVTIKLTPDDDVVETGWEIGQYADNLGRRIARPSGCGSTRGFGTVRTHWAVS